MKWKRKRKRKEEEEEDGDMKAEATERKKVEEKGRYEAVFQLTSTAIIYNAIGNKETKPKRYQNDARVTFSWRLSATAPN